MIVELGNFWYFFFIISAVGIVVGLYYFFRNRSNQAKEWLILGLVLFNLVLHFAKLLFPPYSTDPQIGMRDVWFINICAVSVLFFPFCFISKSKVLRDYMFYLGVISGFIALGYPTEAFENSVLTFDVWRFYCCHMIIGVAPLLMVLLKIHTLNYQRIIYVPCVLSGVFLFIMCNQILQSELGIVPLRGDDIFAIGYRNNSFIWGPSDDLAKFFTFLTPDFMKTIPAGAYAGEIKYWPFFWLLPALFVYFTILPFLLSLPWEGHHFIQDCRKIVYKIGSWFKKTDKEKSISV